METENNTEVLVCGCIREFVAGKYILIACDEHDEDAIYDEPEQQITKFRKSFE